MILDSAENKCILEVLRILNKGKSKYSIMFKETQVSHTTLQAVLKDLETKKFIIKHNKGHMDVDYEISEKGKKLLSKLIELQDVLR